MRGLDVSGNANLASYAALANSNVHALRVQRNNLTDLAPFLVITSLDDRGLLEVTENAVDCAAQSAHIVALQQRGVRVQLDCLRDGGHPLP